jgi:hypothetical protein
MIVSAVIAIGGLAVPAQVRRRAGALTATAAVIACLAAPLAYTAQTISTAHTGSTPSAGPTATSAAGGPGGSPFGGGGRAFGGGGNGGAPGGTEVNGALIKALKSGSSDYRWVAATSGSQSAASLELASGGLPVMAIGGFSGQGGNLTLAQFKAYVKSGDIHYYIAGGGGAGGFGGAGGGAGGGFGGAGGSRLRGSAESALGSLFGDGTGGSGAIGAGPPTGGFGGRRPGGPGGGSSTQSITTWVEAHYKSVTIGSETVYDLTQAKT